MTGETVAGPFTGHTDSVNSVALSPHSNFVHGRNWATCIDTQMLLLQ